MICPVLLRLTTVALKPWRSRVAPALMVRAEADDRALAAPRTRVPPLMVVVPVWLAALPSTQRPVPALVKLTAPVPLLVTAAARVLASSLSPSSTRVRVWFAVP